MSTRGVIARKTGDGTFTGRYHHSDSYPTGLGKTLAVAFHERFKGDMNAMLAFLIDEHPAGWSCIVGSDLNLKPGYTDMSKGWPSLFDFEDTPEGKAKREAKCKAFYQKPTIRRGHCYCHGERHEKGCAVTQADDAGCEWAYALDAATLSMTVYARKCKAWSQVAVVSMLVDPTNIEWGKIECGENFERCGHLAYYHFPELRGTPSGQLGTRTYLGYESLEDFNNAKAVIIDGERWDIGGGCHSDYAIGHRCAYTGKRPAWIGSLSQGDKRTNKPVAYITKAGYKPFPGVAWVFPPTKANPVETLLSA